MKNLKIKVKMMLAFAILLAAVAFVGFYSTIRLGDIVNYTGTVDPALTAQASSSRGTIRIITIASMIAGTVFALYIAVQISDSLTKLSKLVKDVTDGNLNVNIDRSAVTLDEVGMLTGDVHALINTVKSINDDIVLFAKNAGDLGEYDYRMDDKKYKGAYSILVKDINLTVDAADKATWILQDAIEAAGKGDFNHKAEILPGKSIIFNQALDKFFKNLHDIEDQINLMIDAAAVKGNLAFNIDTRGYEGDWKKLLNGLNDVADAVNAPITEIRDVMDNLSRGLFDKKVEGNYNGDFLKIKTAANHTLNVLREYIQEISSVVTAVAAGDLTVKITREYVGEFTQIKRSINSISEILHKAVSEISLAAKYILEGSTKISSSAMDLADGSTAQAASLEELHSTVDMINKQTVKFAENAREANTLSSKSTTNAQEGSNSMAQMVDAMSKIRESSNSIAGIIKTIEEIAFQTNLLALNASVEAARAGVHGAGFAVVAEEVRTLSVRSSNAAAETATMIQDSLSRVEAGTNIADATSRSLNAIVKGADDVMTLISNITTAATDQAAMITDISDTLLHTATTVQSNSKFAHESAATSEELNSQSEMLRQLVAYFKL